MARRSNPKLQKENFSIFEKWVVIGIAIAIAFFFVGYFFKGHNNSLKATVLETPKNEMKTLPPDIKKQLQTKPASISATLRVPILMYHYVEYVQDKKDTIRQSLNIQPFTFDQQIKTLLNAGYTFITAKDLGDVLDGKMELPAKPIILTFDDGHWDLATDVLPILKKYNVHATAYIVAGFIGTNSDSLNRAQMQELIDSGLIDIGAHTVHHISLKGQPLAKVQNEVDESKTMLEQEYNLKVYSFAYPYGAFDQQAVNIVKQAGFTTATSTVPGIVQSQQNRFFLYRLRPGYRTGQVLLNYLNQNIFGAYN
ncbi:MAG TPA: polysaccharide deacetylase family protein [Patescibacteria group bacterium]